MENSEKIKVATELLNTTKDYIELLKVAPKMKQTFNIEVINEQIQLNDNVGLMTMNNSTFIVFDELSLYIPTTKNELRKYGIEKVNYIT